MSYGDFVIEYIWQLLGDFILEDGTFGLPSFEFWGFRPWGFFARGFCTKGILSYIFCNREFCPKAKLQ